ncbi:RDD family protein [Nocardia sp. NPDC059180]|uniref:RDD family protein n=1 Tax=Nocardia sp. NPDC059180 TaxID=3346761 RepID=UPI00368182FF
MSNPNSDPQRWGYREHPVSYGQPYPQQSYGQPYAYPSGPPGMAPSALPAPPAYAYASWWSRVVAYLIDAMLAVVPGVIILSIGLIIATAPTRAAREQYGPTADADPNGAGILIAVVGGLTLLAVIVWNQVIRQGRTGQSLGKKLLGIAVILEATGRPMGWRIALGRWVVQMLLYNAGFCLVFGILGLLDSLWPLWDAKHQTWHDKVVNSVVVRAR